MSIIQVYYVNIYKMIKFEKLNSGQEERTQTMHILIP